MNALLADTPPAAPEQGQSAPPAGQLPPSTAGQGQAGASGRVCANCGNPLAADQDWCLNCGAAATGGADPGGWRQAAGILAVTAVLVLAAAAAGVAALSKKSPQAAVVTTTVAQTVAPAAATPAVTTPTTPTTPTTGLAKPPKIPVKALTPAPAPTTPAATTPTNPTQTTETTAGKEEGATGKTGGSSAKKEPEAILLDTNAAQTYNPYGYPASNFGDPSLTIDGDTTTAWTAQVDPATAPRMAEGMLIDLKTPQRLSVLKLITTTPGMTIQVYGANGHTLPASITDKAWVKLTHAVTVKKRRSKLTLRNQKKAYRYITLWISKAPASAVGTPTAPGHVSVSEIELLPAP